MYNRRRGKEGIKPAIAMISDKWLIGCVGLPGAVLFFQANIDKILIFDYNRAEHISDMREEGEENEHSDHR